MSEQAPSYGHRADIDAAIEKEVSISERVKVLEELACAMSSRILSLETREVRILEVLDAVKVEVLALKKLHTKPEGEWLSQTIPEEVQ